MVISFLGSGTEALVHRCIVSNIRSSCKFLSLQREVYVARSVITTKAQMTQNFH